MTDQRHGPEDPIIRRVQQAFAHEEPATELPDVLRRAAGYLAPGHGLTMADLIAARRREPAAVSRVYTAYAPGLFRFFVAAIGDRHTAEDLTGQVFASAIESLPGFGGPVEALGGWLFRIARHELFDYRRRQARVPLMAGETSRTQTALHAIQAVLDRGGAVPQATLHQALQPLLDKGDRATDAPLHRLSPREREILALVQRGRSLAQIGRELFISPHTVRVHLQNILAKLEMAFRLGRLDDVLDEAALAVGVDDPEELAIGRIEGDRVLAAIQQLPPDQREVLLLRMAGGLTAPEVAAVLDKTTGAVKALQHRGRASLARILSRSSPESDDAAATLPASPWLRPPPLGREDMSDHDSGPTARADGE
jgi:RNA polymerase sigma factor (sigma-70 family)